MITGDCQSCLPITSDLEVIDKRFGCAAVTEKAGRPAA